MHGDCEDAAAAIEPALLLERWRSMRERSGYSMDMGRAEVSDELECCCEPAPYNEWVLVLAVPALVNVDAFFG